MLEESRLELSRVGPAAGEEGEEASEDMLAHTMSQVALSDELQGIEEALGLKEQLLSQLLEGTRPLLLCPC